MYKGIIEKLQIKYNAATACATKSMGSCLLAPSDTMSGGTNRMTWGPAGTTSSPFCSSTLDTSAALMPLDSVSYRPARKSVGQSASS